MRIKELPSKLRSTAAEYKKWIALSLFPTIGLFALLATASDDNKIPVDQVHKPATTEFLHQEKSSDSIYDPATNTINSVDEGNVPELGSSVEFTRAIASNVLELKRLLFRGQSVITILTDTIKYPEMIEYLNQFTDRQILGTLEQTGTHQIVLENLDVKLDALITGKRIVTVFDSNCLQAHPYQHQIPSVRQIIENGRLATVQVNMIKFGEEGEEIPYNVYTLYSPENFDAYMLTMGVHGSTFSNPGTGHGSIIFPYIINQSQTVPDRSTTFFCASALSGDNYFALLRKFVEKNALSVVVNRSLGVDSPGTTLLSIELNEIFSGTNAPVIVFFNSFGNESKTTKVTVKDHSNVLRAAAYVTPGTFFDFSNRPEQSDEMPDMPVIAAPGVINVHVPYGYTWLVGTSASSPHAMSLVMKYFESLTDEEIQSYRTVKPLEIFKDALAWAHPQSNFVEEYPNLEGGFITGTLTLTPEEATAISKTLGYDASLGEILGAQIIFSDTQLTAHDHDTFGIDPAGMREQVLGKLTQERAITYWMRSSAIPAVSKLNTTSGTQTKNLEAVAGNPNSDRLAIYNKLVENGFDQKRVMMIFTGGKIVRIPIITQPQGEIQDNRIHLPIVHMQ